MKFTPHNYQHNALRWLIDRTIVQGEAGGAFFMDPGLGKTSTTLCWVRLLKMLGLAKRTLVVAPLRVIYSVWPAETQKWSQFSDITTSIVHGSPKKRTQALNRDADLYLINPEGMPWLKDQNEDFDALVVDESTKFKTWGSKRMKALRKIVPSVPRRLILTGTPSPNGIADLFSQIFILDQGESLGTGVTKFRKEYFYRGGFGGYEWKPSEGSQQRIEKKISHLCYRLSAKDHLDLPELITNDVWVDMPAKAHKDYKTLEREMFLALDNGEELVSQNAGSKYNSCRQMAGGAVYDDERNHHEVHKAKIEAVTDLVDELGGKPALIAFNYTHELRRLESTFPGLPAIHGGVDAQVADQLITDWNAGKLHVLAVQPKSLSHGINMQSGPGRDIIWFGLTDSLEEYQQLNARIHRQGVKGDVRIHRVLTRKTVDEAIVERIESKEHSQNTLLDALNEYRRKRGN